MAINQKTPKKRSKKWGNQYMADPRQSAFLANYLNTKSPTYSNALQSALAAGYAQEYAESLTAQAPDWLTERLGELASEQMLRKAERNLDEALDFPTKVQAMGPFGPLYEEVPTGKYKMVKGKRKPVTKKVPIMTYAISLIKERNSTSQFVAERLGKRKYGSKGDTNVNVQVNVFSPEQVTRVATRVLNGDPTGESAPDRLPNSDESAV